MSEAEVRQAFAEQGEICETMGSPFTGNLCRILGENLDHSTKVGALCLDWPGDPSGKADSIPLRICGGFHALVLTGQDAELAKNYPPNSDRVAPWGILKTTLEKHEAFLLDWMQSPPQTNEVARSSVIWPGLMAIAEQTNLPLRLLEVGASGGLNLQSQHFSYDLGGVKCGAENSALLLDPEWRGKPPKNFPVTVRSAEGCDLNPLDPTSKTDALRLRSYVWPDQVQRQQRLNAALDIAEANPIIVDKTDALIWLKEKLAEPVPGCCTVIYSTIAWQYLPPEARAEGEANIREAGSKADAEQSPLAWLRFEADGATPGAGVHLNLWPQNLDVSLGRADFHARWVNWQGID